MDSSILSMDDFGLFTARVLMNSLWLLLSIGVPLGIWFLISLPMRRRERTQLILDLLDRGIRSGQTPEQVLIDLADCNDRSLGSRFHRIARLLREGKPLDQALAQSPGFLPAQILSILRAGCALGDVAKVIPACRRSLEDAQSQTRGALNFLPILSLVLLPTVPAILSVLHVWIEPKFKMIWSDFDPADPTHPGQLLPPYLRLLLGTAPLIVMGFFYLALFLYVFGPWLRRGLQKAGLPLLDWAACHVPWQWRRLQRDFATLLALLLDSGVPEADAIRIAGEGTGNVWFQRRTRRMLALLQQGHPLPSALRGLDRAGEFEWRLGNAAHSSQGFLCALQGWLESLEARAFQQQQAAAHLLSTAVILVNGLVVGIVTLVVFQFLTGILNSEALW